MKTDVRRALVIFTVMAWLGMFFGYLPSAHAADNGLKIMINGSSIKVPAGDQAPFCLQGRTYVPLRVISEGLGARVEWRASTRQVVIYTPGAVVSPVAQPVLRNGNRSDIEVVINGQVLVIPPEYGRVMVTRLGRTVVPMRVIGQALGCQVTWDAATRTVFVTSNPVASDSTEDSTGGPNGGVDENADKTRLVQELASYHTNLKLSDGTVINTQDLTSKDISTFSEADLQLFQTALKELQKYTKEIQLPDGTVIPTWSLEIKGKSIATADQLKSWIQAETPRIQAKMEQNGRVFQPIPLELVDLYLQIGSEYGIRGDLAFCQAVKETEYFQFTGLVQSWQNNYCGLWATGSACTGQESLNGADPGMVKFQPGVHGAIFSSPAAGVEAHIQHLYAYATKESLPSGKVLCDPRFGLVARGSAPTWQGLNARWAVPGITYGQSIIQDYWLKALNR
ncbi:stalk domain-containing protein [Syntrophothermus lipocalidus]|uniref:stalk domain-containing protein n=1 Tax=Syntrophothermus lipocalidus TaxID=86170 RepID=UPI001F619C58|nr:stalk domain-containing protein [Syntrophothermus lipocalidus]